MAILSPVRKAFDSAIYSFKNDNYVKGTLKFASTTLGIGLWATSIIAGIALPIIFGLAGYAMGMSFAGPLGAWFTGPMGAAVGAVSAIAIAGISHIFLAASGSTKNIDPENIYKPAAFIALIIYELLKIILRVKAVSDAIK